MIHRSPPDAAAIHSLGICPQRWRKRPAGETCESHTLNRRPERRLRGFSLSQLTAPRQESSIELVSHIFKTHRRRYRTLLFQPGGAAQVDTCKGSEPISGPDARSTDQIPAHFPRFRSAFYRHNNPTAPARHPGWAKRGSCRLSRRHRSHSNTHQQAVLTLSIPDRLRSSRYWLKKCPRGISGTRCPGGDSLQRQQPNSLGRSGRRGPARAPSLTCGFDSVSRCAGRVRHTGDAVPGGAVEAVFARAVGSYRDVVDGLLKVYVCGSVEDRPKVRTQQGRQRGAVAPLLLVSQYG